MRKVIILFSLIFSVGLYCQNTESVAKQDSISKKPIDKKSFKLLEGKEEIVHAEIRKPDANFARQRKETKSNVGKSKGILEKFKKANKLLY